jgi:hypothetical protein
MYCQPSLTDNTPDFIYQTKNKKAPGIFTSQVLISSVPARARTVDPLIKSQLLYQLSYRDKQNDKISNFPRFNAPTRGLTPMPVKNGVQRYGL